MTTFLFPGQGSQKVGMGKDLFGSFSNLVSKASSILGYSIEELCVTDPEKQLNQTQFTQPALYVVNALSYLARIEETGKKPDFVAGHSLGEYDALFAANAFDFETGLKLVQKRSQLMAEAQAGGMAAIIGLSPDRIQEIIEENSLKHISIANYNSPSQVVVSGGREEVAAAKDTFESSGARMYIVLKVSGAFHSPYMEPAKVEFEKFLANFQFSDLSIPVISNVTARPYQKSKIGKLLAQQLDSPVKWLETIQVLMGKGEEDFEEVGPGNVLKGLVRQIVKEAKPLTIEDEPEEVSEVVETSINERVSEPQESSSAGNGSFNISAENLGSKDFKKDYGCRYAYIAGAMYKGIASKELVVRMGKANLLSFLGTGGMKMNVLEENIQYIQDNLPEKAPYGMNLLCNLIFPEMEDETVDLFFKYGIKNVEASAYMQMTPSLVRYRLKGLKRNSDGTIHIPHQIIAKISRPEVAEGFMSPAPEKIVQKLVAAGKITEEEAELGKEIPIATDICTEADSGGHTDQRAATSLIPAVSKLRDEMMEKFQYAKKIRIGAAGGIGTPEAAAAAFIMGVDFVLTGSINQCTVEAGTSDNVKDMLEGMNIQDTAYAPAGDMFEIGARVQVLKKGLFFPARANKLYDLYRLYNSIDDIDEKTKKQIQDKYFKRSFDEVWEETEEYYRRTKPDELEKAAKNPKHKMSLIFRWYFVHTTRLAMKGSEEQRVDYQIHCGPALGAFNQWVKGTKLESWKNRHVDEIAELMMDKTASYLTQRMQQFKEN